MNKITAVILAGGLGTRLRSEVNDRQKTVAIVKGVPFFFFLLDKLRQADINEVVICCGYLSETVEAALEAYKGNMKITLSYEESPLGTGGAIVNALKKINSSHLLVMNGDSFINCDLKRFISYCFKNSCLSCLVCTRVDDVSRYGAVLFNESSGLVRSFKEKNASQGPGYINTGVYLFSTRDLAEYSGNVSKFSLENELFPKLVEKNELYAFPCKGEFIDIGLPNSYREATAFFSRLD